MKPVGKKRHGLLVRLYQQSDTRMILWCLVPGASVLGIGLLFIWPAAAILALLIGACAAVICLLGRRALHRVRIESFRDAVLRQLKRTGLPNFQITEVIGYDLASEHTHNKAAEEAYALFCQAAAKDAKISDKERGYLDHLASRLKLDPHSKQRIETYQAQQRYATLVSSALSDGILTDGEGAALKEARRHLAIADNVATQLNQAELRDAYRALFRRFAEDGILTDAEFGRLEEFRQATGLSLPEAAQISLADAKSLFTRTLAMVCQDQAIQESDRQKLTALAQALTIPGTDVARGLAQFESTLNLAKVRRGQLPSLKTRLLIRSTEICHYEAPCQYSYRTPTQKKVIDGKLTVTNKRLILTGERSFEVNLKRIVDIREYTNAVKLTLSVRRGQGMYFVDEGRFLGAILTALVRGYNRELFEDSHAIRSRRIPDHVKVEVWRRDGGRCVRCGATEYLEFDHIIPFSQGGSNSAKNIQILCRKCNLAKSDSLV